MIGSNVDVSKIILAVRIGGNITNTVTAGRVFSMVVDGSITADVTSSNSDTLTDFDDDSIGFLSAGNAILGNITATLGSINTLWCGVGNASAGGIDGDIKAENGLIQDILSTGPIGANRPSNNKVKVRAGYGIIQTTCRYVTPQGVVQARNMTAEVRADVQADPSVDDPATQEQHGKIEKLYVSGNYSGEIRAWMVRPEIYYEGDPFGDHGIFITGSMTGSITIERMLLTATIRAREFTQPVIVGERFKGTLHATHGGIHSLIVGRDPQYANQQTGISGSLQAPSWATGCGSDPDEPIALIKAATTIGLIDATNNIPFDKSTPCQIQSPHIGTLRIDMYGWCITWSGNGDEIVDSNGDGFIDAQGPDPSDDGAYAVIDSIKIGDMLCGEFDQWDCLGNSSIYVEDFESCVIGRTMGARILMPSLREERTIWIGCQLDSFVDPGTIGLDGVPGDPTFETCGQIIVRDELGLKGQVIVNGGNNYPACVPPNQDPVRAEWTGLVKITEDPDDIRLYPGADDPDDAPFYLRPASQLGGYWDAPDNDYSRGAVGVAPFALHHASCSPATDPTDPGLNPPQIMQTAFQHSLIDQGEWIDVILDFYGPIVPSSAAAPLIRAFHLVNGNTIDITPYIVAEIVDEPVATFSRKLRLHGAGNYRFTVGVIRIEPMPIDINNPALGFTLRSDDVNGFPSVRPFEYYFELLHDCNNDNIEDPIDPLPMNRVLEGYCPADFNLDGFVDYFDYTDYVDCFETANCPPLNDADVNGDAFVDYFDYDMFVEIFEAGC